MKRTITAAFLLILTIWILAACSPVPALRATPTTDVAAPTASVATQAPAPSPTTRPGKVLFISPVSEEAAAVQAALEQMTKAAGLTLNQRDALQQAELTAEIKTVVLLSAPPNLSDIAAAAPQTQFIAVSAVDLPAAANLTVIRRHPDQQAFLAGFVSVLLSTDYRGAGLLPTDGPMGESLKDAFTNGAHYFCGVCAPGWPLKMYYPQIAELPAASDGPAWQAAAADLFDNGKVQVFFLSAESSRPELLAYLQGKTQLDSPVILLGVQPPPDEVREQWAATIHDDLPAALQQAWPDVLAGKGGTVVDAPLLVDHVNSDLLGEGRLRLVKDLMEELKSGKVYPFTIPAQ